MLFIVSSNVDKVDPATRKLIRSHAMGGKKQRRALPGKKRGSTRQATMSSRTQTATVKLEEVIAYAPLLPGRVGSDLSFVEFSDEVEPSLLVNIAKFSTIATRIIFPLIVAIGFRTDRKEALYPLIIDAAALHITAFAVESFIHRVLQHREHETLSPSAMLHFQKGLRLLRERLVGDDDKTKVSDSTIGVVLKLASAANFDGDFRAAKQHMNGLRKIVDLRGGLDCFNDSEFQSEMLRCDLCIALLSGCRPVFFRQPLEPVIPYPEKLLPTFKDTMGSGDKLELLQHVDEDLAIAWGVMKRFCLLVNLGTQTERLISPEIIHWTMTAVMYRLLHMIFDAESLDEAVRLGLLAFSHHIFLQWQGIKPPSSHYPAAYRDCIMNLQKLGERIPARFLLWLLMTGAVSFFEIADEAWLRVALGEYANKCQVKPWNEMQEVLKSFLWIAVLDEQPAKRVYDFLCPNRSKGYPWKKET